VTLFADALDRSFFFFARCVFSSLFSGGATAIFFFKGGGGNLLVIDEADEIDSFLFFSILCAPPSFFLKQRQVRTVFFPPPEKGGFIGPSTALPFSPFPTCLPPSLVNIVDVNFPLFLRKQPSSPSCRNSAASCFLPNFPLPLFQIGRAFSSWDFSPLLLFMHKYTTTFF